MPVYQVSMPMLDQSAAHPIGTTGPHLHDMLSWSITKHHSEILGSLPSEVVVIFLAQPIIYRGGIEDPHHIRVLGTIARGRTREQKASFMDAVTTDIQHAFNKVWAKFGKSTFAITLTECEPEDVARCVGSGCSDADRSWAESIPAPRQPDDTSLL